MHIHPTTHPLSHRSAVINSGASAEGLLQRVNLIYVNLIEVPYIQPLRHSVGGRPYKRHTPSRPKKNGKHLRVGGDIPDKENAIGVSV